MRSSRFEGRYGEDPWTARACDLIRGWLETDCSVFFVFNGTAANALALASICRPYHAVLCHASAHIQHDECGAPEFFGGGTKLLPLPGDHGRLAPEVVETAIREHFPLHASKPAALSLTQAAAINFVKPVPAFSQSTKPTMEFPLLQPTAVVLMNASTWLSKEGNPALPSEIVAKEWQRERSSAEGNIDLTP